MLRHVPRITTVGVEKTALVGILEVEGLIVTEWSDHAHAEYPVHGHAHREVRIVLEGGMTITVAGRSYELGPGDRIDLESDERHSARVHSSGVKYLAGRAR
jgi:quercetin dioxygenase-like cupin family protein